MAVVAGLVLAVLLPSSPAAAENGDEGSNPTLKEVLENATRGYLDAQNALTASKSRQADLARQLADIEARLAAQSVEAEGIASAAYRTGPISTASVMLDSATPERFLDRATVLEGFAARNDKKLRELHNLRQELSDARAKVDAEVAFSEQQAATMAKKKNDAERALAAAGGAATGGYVNASSPLATPAPRNKDGSYPAERCTINDPTTSGCVTARNLHALQQAKAAGFTRFVSCFRPGGPYEHPKGRACDYAAESGGFGGVAAGGDKVYGNNLAAYFVRNATQLGVLYVIWFRQVWTPAVGWHRYSGGNGDPSSDHTNHVHLSVY